MDRNLVRFLLTSTLLTVVAMALAGCRGGETPFARIELRSDPSLLLVAAGETATLDARVVDEAGVEIPDAVVAWASGDPSAVTVTADGVATARSPLGSAVITATYPGAEPIIATVVIARLAERAHRVATANIVDVNEDRTTVTLSTTPDTEQIAIGDVIVNGSRDGFLARVIGRTPASDSIAFDVETATVPEAFEELDISVSSPVVTYEETFEPTAQTSKHADTFGTDTKDNRVGATSAALQQLTFECKAQTQLVNVGLKGLAITPRLGVRSDIDYRVRNGNVERLAIAIEGDLGISASLAAIEARAGVTGKIECKADLTTIPFLPVPIVGPIALSATATPNVGVGLELVYTAAEISANGIQADKATRVRVGFEYNDATGYSTINEQQTIADSVELAKGERKAEDRFTAKVEPFLGIDFGIGMLAGPVLVGRVDMLTAKVFGGFELSITLPLSPEDPAYIGPRWAVYVGVAADMNPLLDELAVANRLLGLLGLNGLEALLGVDLTLFELKTNLLESPEPVITLSSARIQEGNPVDFAVVATAADVSSPVESMLFPSGRMAITGNLDASGSATMTWTPTSQDRGTHQVAAHVYDDIFGDFDLPYASRMKPTLEVTCSGEECDDDSNPTLPPGATPAACGYLTSGRIHIVTEGSFFSASRETESITTRDDGSTGTYRRTISERGTFVCNVQTETEYNGSCDWSIEGTIETESGGRIDTQTFSGGTSGLPFDRTVRPHCTPGGQFRGWSGSITTTSSDWSGDTVTTERWSHSGCAYLSGYPDVEPTGCCQDDAGRWRLCVL